MSGAINLHLPNLQLILINLHLTFTFLSNILIYLMFRGIPQQCHCLESSVCLNWTELRHRRSWVFFLCEYWVNHPLHFFPQPPFTYGSQTMLSVTMPAITQTQLTQAIAVAIKMQSGRQPTNHQSIPFNEEFVWKQPISPLLLSPGLSLELWPAGRPAGSAGRGRLRWG